jgi:hypothetical protein
MRKLRKVFVILFLFCLAMPGVAFAQKQEKITIAKDGSMKDEQGKPIDRKLFAFSTYDAEGKKPMEKGKARHRPETMYIDSSILTASTLTEAQKAHLREMLKAERRIARTNARRTNRRNSNVTRRVSPPQQVVAVANLSDSDLETLANKIAGKITVPAPSGLSTSEFKKEVDKIVADAKQDFKQFVASNSGTTPVVPPADTAVEGTTIFGSIASAFSWTVDWLSWIFISWFGILLLVVLVIYFVIRFLHWRRDRQTTTRTDYRRSETVHEEDGDILASSTKVSEKETRIDKSNDKAFEPA